MGGSTESGIDLAFTARASIMQCMLCVLTSLPTQRRTAARIAAPLVLGECAAALLCSCLRYSPYQAPTDTEDLNGKAIARISASPTPESLRFAVMGDTQLALGETADAVHSLNRQAGLAFVVQVGDFTNYGMLDEYRETEDIMARLLAPHLVVVGGHDLLANGDLIYRRMFGPFNRSFITGSTKFVLLNANSLEADESGSVPDLGWLAAELAPSPDFAQAVVVSHVAPDGPQFDRTLTEGYAAILAAGHAVLSIHGHEHYFRIGELFHDGVLYIVTDRIDRRNYLLFTARPEGGFDFEKVSF